MKNVISRPLQTSWFLHNLDPKHLADLEGAHLQKIIRLRLLVDESLTLVL